MTGPVMVLGGGPAGAMAALTMARAGVSCHVLERGQGGDDRVCGEFLSPEALAFLNELAFPWDGADAVRIRNVRLHRGRHTLTFPLPFEACTLNRRILDAWLLRKASSLGAVIEPGVHVCAITRDRQRFLLETDTALRETEILVLATGKHGTGTFHPRRHRHRHSLIGWKMSFHRISRALLDDLADTLALFFFPGGYGGVVRTGADTLTVSLLIRPVEFRRYCHMRLGFLQALAVHCPLLLTVMTQTEPLWRQPKTISNLPYGHCDDDVQPGLFAVGDQFAVLPSLTGTGIAFAILSGRLAGEEVVRAVANADRSAEQRYARQARTIATVVLRNSMILHEWMQRPLFSALAMGVAHWIPSLLPFIARRTRLSVPERVSHAA